MLKIGLIGCGFMGTMHANCYNILDDVQVVAVADVDREKAHALAKISGTEIYEDGFSLIEHAKVDAIDICLPTYLHAVHAEKAMRKVKNVFIEKPVALNAEECDRLLKVQEETGAGVQVGQVIRFWDEYVYLKEVIDGKKYGKVENAFFSRLSPKPDWGWDNWLTDSERSGGAMLDLHIHDVDYMLYVFGKPDSCCGVHTDNSDEKNGYAMTLGDYGDFVVAVQGSWDFPSDYPFQASFRVKFENAVLEWNTNGLKLYADGNVKDITLDKMQLSAKGGGNISDLGGYYNELKYFTDCLKNGIKPEKASLADAAESVKFIRALMAK